MTGLHFKKRKKCFFVPEVIQSSAMDCGPASLKALLEGFGVSVSYGRLREACQTSVDGTSIDTLEEVSNQLGLEAEQIMLPPDHFFLPEAKALPAIVVVRLPNGVTHFLVVWARHGPFVQLMDPGSGRRWIRCKQFLKEVYIHRMPVSASLWREWAGSEAFLSPLKRRLIHLGTSEKRIQKLIHQALLDPGWYRLGALDAGTRMVDSLVSSGGLQKGEEAAQLLQTFISESYSKDPSQESPIPSLYWSIQPMPSIENEEEQLILKGMVLVRVLGRQPLPSKQKKPDLYEKAPLPLELEAALKEPPIKPGRQILKFLRADGILTPVALGFAFFLASFGFILEAILLRGLFEIGRDLNLIEQRLGAMGVLIIFSIALLLLELPIGSCILKLGRHLESRLRIAFLEKLPRLRDRYFQSRLNSDMAERSHSVHQLRLLPGLGGRLVRSVIEFLITAAAIVWLFPESLMIVLVGILLTISIPLASQSFITERDLRVRSHLGALSRFYLDTLIGLVPTLAHSAQKPIRSEHESLLVEWSRASLRNLSAVLAVEAVQNLIGFGIAFWLLLHYYKQGGPESGVLLLVYWGLHLSTLGQEIIRTALQYPTHRNITLRIIEPLGAPEDGPSQRPSKREDVSISAYDFSKGVSISMEGVDVKISGHSILEGVNLTVPSGAHLAIIGPSGAGKSSLVGLLLDWYRPSAGRILINGKPLTPGALENMRQITAWIDPAIQLWNRSLIENVYYGIRHESARPATLVMEEAQLMELLEKLPQGLGTPLGEGGGLVSGGEGQRVRLARAMAKGDVRLAILDEPFRGLDHQKRSELLDKARSLWKDATMLCITHDISATKSFDRVVVIEQGKIVEQGDPEILAEKADSFYRKYLYLEKAVTEGIWREGFWRRISIKRGRITEQGSPYGKV